MSDLSSRSDRLDERIADSNLGRTLDELSRYSHRTRHLVRWLVVLSTVLVGVVAALGVGFKRADDAAAKATNATHDALVTCQAVNEGRAGNAKLWDYLLSLDTSPTASERQQIVAFRAYLATLFAPQDCLHPHPAAPLPPLPASTVPR
jgi:hypothetical protein